MCCYKNRGDFATLAIQPSAEIIVAVHNHTIGDLLVSLERRAVGNTAVAKPRHAAPPMPKSYPITFHQNQKNSQIELNFQEVENNFAFINLSSKDELKKLLKRKSDILLVVTALILAFSFRCFEETCGFSTLPIQSSPEIIVAGHSQTIGKLLVSLERHAVGTTGMVEPRQSAPPMPKSYPIRFPPKPLTKTEID